MFYKLFESDNNFDNYSGYMDTALDELTQSLYENSIEYNYYINKFDNAMKNAEYLIGAKYAFRKVQPGDLYPFANKKLINKALFVCESVLMADFDFEEVRNKLQQNHLSQFIADIINKDNDLFYYLSYGTNGRNNILYAFHKLKELFNKEINL